MAAIKYFKKRDNQANTNWLWIIGKQWTWLIGWDYHFHGVEVYNYQKFTGKIQPDQKAYTPETKEVVDQVLDKLMQDINGVSTQPSTT